MQYSCHNRPASQPASQPASPSRANEAKPACSDLYTWHYLPHAANFDGYLAEHVQQDVAGHVADASEVPEDQGSGERLFSAAEHPTTSPARCSDGLSPSLVFGGGGLGHKRARQGIA